MSSNHAPREQPDANPYAPPTAGLDSLSPGNPLLAPAGGLLALSSIFMLLVVATIPGRIAHIQAIHTSRSEFVIGELINCFMPPALWLLVNVPIALGAISMLRLRSYRSAYLAAILSLIPLCSPCFLLGIPFGIWTLVLLNRPEVKQRFTG